MDDDNLFGESDPHDELDEFPSEADVDRFGAPADVQCNECSAELYDDADVCPECGAFQIDGPRASEAVGLAGRPLMIAVIAILTAIAFFVVIAV